MTSPIFALIAAAASLIAFAVVMRPLWRAKPRSAAIIIAGLTVSAAGLYQLIGSPIALDAAMIKRPDSIEEALSQLERSRDRFPDHEGWVMLATAYARVGKPEQARDAWEEVLKRAPDDANFLAAAAEARAQVHPQRRFDAKAVEYLRHALKSTPEHQRARFFLGIALRQQNKPAEAAATWEPLLATVDAANADTLRAEIDAARLAAGLPALAAPAMGCWTPVERFGLLRDGMPDDAFDWGARLLHSKAGAADGSVFTVFKSGKAVGDVHWPMLGLHNVLNGLAALAACNAVGVDVSAVIPSLAEFRSVKRRLECLGEAQGITVYDDFAHHPTAIRTTLEGLRAKVGAARIVVAMEPRSNSMRLGAYADALAPSLDIADAVVFLHRPELAWDAGKVVSAIRGDARTAADADALIATLRDIVRAGDHVVFMSNGGFDGAPRRFLAALG